MLTELWSDLRYRARALFQRQAVERELDAELRFHVERQAEVYERTGMPRDEARRRAQLAFGGVERMKEASRDVRGTGVVETLAQDTRFALRSLRKHPSFAITVVLTLAIGIGANAAMFALLDALLLRPLPVGHPDQLVIIGDPAGVMSAWHGSPMVDYVSSPVYADLRDRTRTLAAVYATGQAGSLDVVAPGGDVEHPEGRLVTGNFFSVLEVPASLGRTFTADEDRVPLGDPVVVISDDYWHRRYGADRAALGTTMVVNGVPLTIIGVAPRGFRGDIVGQAIDVWIPMMMRQAIQPRGTPMDDRTFSWLAVMGRLAPGATLAQARAELPVIEARSIRAHLTGHDLEAFDQDLRADPIRVSAGARGFSEFRPLYGPALIVLMTAVALIALVVCANVANLMLARAGARAREMIVRLTLGAGRRRLVQQLLTESAILAAAAGTLGLVLAVWGSRLLLGVAAVGDEPLALDVAPDLRLFAFTCGVTLVCVILFGFAPALRSTRLDLGTALRAHGRGLAGSRARLGRAALGPALVVGQVALSTLLLIGAGLLVHSVQRILTVDLGFDRAHIVTVKVPMDRTGATGAGVMALGRELANQMRVVPGVRAVTYSEEGLFSGGESDGHVTIAGFSAPADSQLSINYDVVGPGYVGAVGGHLVRGRDLDDRDVQGAETAAVINETMARYYFHGVDPIGASFTVESIPFTIVGVVHDMQEQDVRAAPVRRAYLPVAQMGVPPKELIYEVRVAGLPELFVTPIRAALSEHHPSLRSAIKPLDAMVRESVGQDLLLTRVTTFFGLAALLVAAIGLYGITSYSTSQRTGEFGLRSALGAAPRDLVSMILGEALRLAVIGVAIGLPAGLAAAHLIRSQVFGVGTVDVASIAVAVVALTITTMVASYLPARRAARVGPLEALRSE
ncbi:MAG TPA: ABC transporter permease [Gemmatimonadaceae bacterium]